VFFCFFCFGLYHNFVVEVMVCLASFKSLFLSNKIKNLAKQQNAKVLTLSLNLSTPILTLIFLASPRRIINLRSTNQVPSRSSARDPSLMKIGLVVHTWCWVKLIHLFSAPSLSQSLVTGKGIFSLMCRQ